MRLISAGVISLGRPERLRLANASLPPAAHRFSRLLTLLKWQGRCRPVSRWFTHLQRTGRCGLAEPDRMAPSDDERAPQEPCLCGGENQGIECDAHDPS